MAHHAATGSEPILLRRTGEWKPRQRYECVWFRHTAGALNFAAQRAPHQQALGGRVCCVFWGQSEIADESRMLQGTPVACQLCSALHTYASVNCSAARGTDPSKPKASTGSRVFVPYEVTRKRECNTSGTRRRSSGVNKCGLCGNWGRIGSSYANVCRKPLPSLSPYSFLVTSKIVLHYGYACYTWCEGEVYRAGRCICSLG